MALPNVKFDFDPMGNIKWVIETLGDYAKEGHILNINKIGTWADSCSDLCTQYDISVTRYPDAVRHENRFEMAGMVTTLTAEVSRIQNIFDCRLDMHADPEHQKQLWVRLTLMCKGSWTFHR